MNPVWIVLRAADLAPTPIRSRLEEEWLYDLASLDGTLLQWRFAFGCCWAALALRAGNSRFGTTHIREDAFTWLERLRRGLRDEEGPQLRHWLRRRSHRACIARVAAQKDRPEDLAVFGELFEINPDWVLPRQERSLTTNASLALLALIIAALPLCYAHYSVPGLILGPDLEGSFMEAQGTVYTSGAHEVRRLVLPDGTRVLMNRGTRIAAVYAAEVRSVMLVRGEATFTVPRDAHRPFSVTAGDHHFETAGSTFDIGLGGANSIALTVLEGAMTTPGGAPLKAGQKLDIEASRITLRQR